MNRNNTLRGILKQIIRGWIVVVFGGCLSPLDFKTDPVGGMVVISGQVSNIPGRNFVTVGTTANERRLPYPYINAKVFVIDEFGDSVEYIQNKPGYYYGQEAGVPGVAYYVSVQLEDGQVYHSVQERMPVAAGTIDVRYEFETEDIVDAEGTVIAVTNIKIFGTSTLPSSEETTFMKWSTEEVYQIIPTDFPDPFGNVPANCYVTQTADPQRIVLYNGVEVAATNITDQLLLTRQVDQSFHSRHYFTTYQSAITFAAYEYWRKVNIVANQVGSIFDSPPAEVRGNVYNISDNDEQVAGYFQAVNQTYARFNVYQSELPRPLAVYCEFDPNRQYWTYPSECLDCITARNSSFERPEWFGD
jgi:hypothetical protein